MGSVAPRFVIATFIVCDPVAARFSPVKLIVPELFAGKLLKV
jgi:hypothetical protein